VLELNLKAKDEERYYKDAQGKYYRIKVLNKNNEIEEIFISADSDDPDTLAIAKEQIETYKENVFDLYKKY
jgi:hypothetical protein